MQDLISRKWLIGCVNEGWIRFDTENDTNRYIHIVRDIAPSVQPEQRWIPCSERLPEYGEAIVQYGDGDFDLLQFPTAYRREDIVAWMPLPPYREDDHD